MQSHSLKITLAQAGLFLGILIILELLVRASLVSALILSAPSTIALKIWEDVRGAEFWSGLGTSAMEFLVASAISLSLGILFGILFFRYRPFGSAVEPILLAFYAAPTILLYPVFLALFGLGSWAVVSMAVVFGSIPIMVNVSVGLAGVDPILIKLGRSLKATRFQMFWKIMVPAATPTIFAGFRLGLTYTLLGVIAVEFITFSGGLGKLVSWRYYIFDTEGLFAGIVFIVLIAVLMNHFLRRGEERIRRRWT
jgi:ABC-type nitrate/sulfonate/bicarbonate transport system permease component